VNLTGRIVENHKDCHSK